MLKLLSHYLGETIFAAVACALLAVIVYGIYIGGIRTRPPWLVEPERRFLVVQSTKGVSADVALSDLKKDPQLEIKAAGLPPGQSFDLWLVDPTGKALPLELERDLTVDDKGKASQKVRLPPEAMFRYGSVWVVKNRVTWLRAPLS